VTWPEVLQSAWRRMQIVEAGTRNILLTRNIAQNKIKLITVLKIKHHVYDINLEKLGSEYSK